MSPPRSRPLATTVVGLGLLGVLTTACVQPDDPGVGIASFQADLVFGIDLPEETTDPLLPNQGPVAPVPAGLAGGTSSLVVPAAGPGRPPRGFEPSFAARFENLPLGPGAGPGEVAACPPAGLSASPAEAAPENVTAPPPEGLFRWQRAGTQSVPVEGGEPTTVPITGFENRLVREVTDIPAPRPTTSDGPVSEARQYDFEVVQPLLGGGGVLVTSYRVKPGALARDAGANQLPSRVRAGEADRGVALVGIEQFDEDGNSVAGGRFVPSTPVLLLPLPVQPGETFRSVAVDARSGKTLVHEAQVSRREAVDACGTLVDGWFVTATQTLSGAAQAERTIEYVVATGSGLGGMVVRESVTEERTDGSFDATFTIGQLEPSPLPEPEG